VQVTFALSGLKQPALIFARDCKRLLRFFFWLKIMTCMGEHSHPACQHTYKWNATMCSDNSEKIVAVWKIKFAWIAWFIFFTASGYSEGFSLKNNPTFQRLRFNNTAVLQQIKHWNRFNAKVMYHFRASRWLQRAGQRW